MKNPVQHHELVDAERMARVLSVRPSQVKKLARDGRIPHVEISSNVLRFEVERVLEALRQEVVR